MHIILKNHTYFLEEYMQIRNISVHKSYTLVILNTKVDFTE